MDQINPTNHTIHEPFDGENLTREQLGGPCPVYPSQFTSGLVVSVILIAIGAAVYAWNLAQGVPA